MRPATMWQRRPTDLGGRDYPSRVSDTVIGPSSSMRHMGWMDGSPAPHYFWHITLTRALLVHNRYCYLHLNNAHASTRLMRARLTCTACRHCALVAQLKPAHMSRLVIWRATIGPSGCGRPWTTSPSQYHSEPVLHLARRPRWLPREPPRRCKDGWLGKESKASGWDGALPRLSSSTWSNPIGPS